MEQKPNVVMMGLGYIGLPTAALMASKNLQVLGVDVNPKVVEIINQGKIHFVESNLDGLVHHGVKRGFLKASTTVVKADVYLVAVPTPFKGDHEPDIAYVQSATEMIIPHLEEGALFIIESTSPIGTTEKMGELIYSKRPELKGKIHLAYCPERVLPGNVIHELEHNDRVIGGVDEAASEKAMTFYRNFVKGDLHKTNARTAEMCKLTENASRDVSIAFANELSLICDKAGIDVWELIQLANKHPRVNILQPGVGVGGHCIAVDPWFIVSAFPEESKLIRGARELNNYKSDWVIEKIKNAALTFENKNGRKPVIACFGLAFKPNIDDLRESPALYIASEIVKYDTNTMVVEPNVEEHKDFTLSTMENAIEKADILALLVSHREFEGLNNKSKAINFCGLK
jgi:UDP-N-acetyl-D-mannosaminuronic acid dehydrogenase